MTEENPTETALSLPTAAQMPTDILAYDPASLKGNFHRAARASQIAEQVLANLPKWLGRHPRVAGNFPIAEVTRFGTLLVTNEITMADLAGFLTWVCQHAGMNVSPLQECGHPASARVVTERTGEGVFGLTAEEATNQATHCSMCEKEKRQQGELLDARATLEDLRSRISHQAGQLVAKRTDENAVKILNERIDDMGQELAEVMMIPGVEKLVNKHRAKAKKKKS